MVSEDLSFKGYELKRGDAVILIIGSANRDEAKFSDADKLVLDRQANQHLSFGKGVHYCLGAPLARLEADIGLNALLSLPNLRLAVPVADLRWRNSPGFKGLERLPVKWV
jgi:cytochrome P450 PksS